MENNEEKTVKDAQVQAVDNQSSEKGQRKRRKRDFYVELALFFILGILIGVAFKTEAVKRVTIGFEDYKMKIKSQDYDVNKIEADLVEKQKKEQAESQEGATPSEPSQDGASSQNN